MRPRSSFAFVFCLSTLATVPTATADIIHLDDGSRLVGETEERAEGLRLRTIDGRVMIERDRVSRVIAASDLERAAAERVAHIAADDVDGWLVAARMAAQQGRFERAFEHADRALRAAMVTDAEPSLPQELLDLPIGDEFRNDPLTPRSLAVLMNEAARSNSPARGRIARHRLESKLANLDARIPPPLVAALGERLAADDPRVRVAALRAIAITTPAELAAGVGDRLVADRDAAVRAAALDAARAYGENQLILARVLRRLDGDEKARAAALDVLEALSDRHAVAALVRTLAGEGSGVSASAASMSVTNQVTYVSDFDVEVAQNAVIADPIVGVAQEGATLDVTIYGVSSRRMSTAERERIGRLLERLTGARHGADPRAWRSWLEAAKR